IHIGDPDGEIARIVEREQCGWNFCIGEVGPLVQCILRLSQKPHEAAEAGYRARLAFDRQYARGHALKHWRSLLDSVSDPALQCQEEGIARELPVAAGKK